MAKPISFLSLLALMTLFFAPSDVAAQNREMRFCTEPALYAVNGEWLTYTSEVPEGMVDLQSKYQNMMYWYSMYARIRNVIAFVSVSGALKVSSPKRVQPLQYTFSAPKGSATARASGTAVHLMFLVIIVGFPVMVMTQWLAGK